MRALSLFLVVLSLYRLLVRPRASSVHSFPRVDSLSHVIMVNLPSPKDAASKSGEVLSGSSKEYKKESTAARVLGAGA